MIFGEPLVYDEMSKKSYSYENKRGTNLPTQSIVLINMSSKQLNFLNTVSPRDSSSYLYQRINRVR
jgi:hypothetical protein